MGPEALSSKLTTTHNAPMTNLTNLTNTEMIYIKKKTQDKDKINTKIIDVPLKNPFPNKKTETVESIALTQVNKE